MNGGLFSKAKDMSVSRIFWGLMVSIPISSNALAGDFPSAFEGERTLRNSGWTGKVVLRALTYKDGRFTGRGDLFFKPSQFKASPCNRVDSEIFGEFSATSDGSIETMAVTFPSTRGPSCDDLKVLLKRDPSTETYTSGAVGLWTLRAVK